MWKAIKGKLQAATVLLGAVLAESGYYTYEAYLKRQRANIATPEVIAPADPEPVAPADPEPVAPADPELTPEVAPADPEPVAEVDTRDFRKSLRRKR